MNIDDLKLRTKNLIPLAVMAATVAAMVIFGATRLISVSSTASDVIEKRDVAAMKVSRAGRMVVKVVHAVELSILADDGTPFAIVAAKEIKEAPAAADALLAAAAAALPHRVAELTKFRDRVKTLAQHANPVFELAVSQPGLDSAATMKPAQLETLARVAEMTFGVESEAQKLLEDLTAYNDDIVAENARAARDLHEQSQFAVMALAVSGALCTLLAFAFSFWLSMAKIERPLSKLGERMRRLTEGDVDSPVAGQARQDEIGEMARAVEVFRTNAVERAEIESRLETNRRVVETEREKVAAERASAAESQGAAMKALRDGLKRLAEGNLALKLEEGFSTDYAEIRDDFNAAAGKLRGAMTAVATSTGAIHSSTRAISSAADTLSQRTEQQAANLEETAAALEEITTTLKNSAKGAQHAAEVVANADADAKKGAVVVRKAVDAMDAIADSSNKIGQIIGVIDEIAFQTNLLALNAGVEAARAGDSGKGFAVVASEVRALAQRSAEAAKEIKALVSTSGSQVETGVQLVADTGKALEAIIGQVSEINKVVADIAAGAQQQATGLQQINVAINQMDQSTQRNATMVEESTAASHSLSQEMSELAKLVEQFRVGDLAEDKLRRDLKAAAPHAFARPKPAAPPRAAAKPPMKEAARPVKALVNSGADWTEF